MRLVRLEGSFHHSSLVQKVRKAIHMERIQKVDLEEEPPSHVIPIEWNTLHQGDMSHKSGHPVVCIPTEADSQSMVDREMKTSDRGVHYSICELSDQSRCGYTVRTFFWRQWPIVFNIEVWKCAVDMNADSLPGLGGAKYSNHGHFRLKGFLSLAIAKRQRRI